MNRLKVWLFVLLVAAAGVAAARLVANSERKAATRALDARLDAGGARFAAAIRTLSSETAAVATLAARDARLVELLHAKEAPGPRKASPGAASSADEVGWEIASRAAIGAAEKAAGFKLPEDTQIVTGNHAWLARKAQDAGAADKELVEALGAAIAGESHLGWVRWSDRLWYCAAVPSGVGAGLLLLVPVDAEFLRTAMAGAGTEITLLQPGAKPIGSGQATAAVEAAASRRGAGPRDAGRLALAAVDVLGVRVPKPSPLFLAGAPAHRVVPVTIPGLTGVTVVASVSATSALAPAVEVQWTLLAGTLVLAVVGFLFGLLVRPGELPPPVPSELLAAADRIGRGDFTTHAPALAGKLGTVAAALNRAVDAAAAAGRAGGPAASLTQEFFAGGEKAPALPPVPPLDLGPRPSSSRSAPVEPLPPAEPLPAAPDAGPTLLGGGAFEAAPVPGRPPSAVVAPPPPAVIAPPPPRIAQASPPELLQAAARAAPPAEADGEEQHWREVFQDFLRVRGECGEPSEGLTFERFRAKLESNRTALVAKYACKTVRFQVYVKQGKAALKATPVR
ncbi:MXAN_5187 family protein [Anaeromyxobacter oryzisoli]|uniref:MXAN_5187 family protein n=1 Tax=Anaeromyxobacter oryzisoli TaxID=2925408 RepID=UPI001F59C9E2|nr:MXAN_5187 family protein [Anaeromyxobacter sp. SG63]